MPQKKNARFGSKPSFSLTATIIKINLNYLQRSLRIFFNMLYKKHYEHKVAITDTEDMKTLKRNSLKVIQEYNILKF